MDSVTGLSLCVIPTTPPCVYELYDCLSYELQGALLLFNAGAILNEKRVLEKCTWDCSSSSLGCRVVVCSPDGIHVCV